MRPAAEFGTAPLAEIRLKKPMQGELPFDLDGYVLGIGTCALFVGAGDRGGLTGL